MVSGMLTGCALLLAACSAAEAGPESGLQTGSAQPVSGDANATNEGPRVHSVSGLDLIEVTIESGGTAHVFKTELADTPQAQARGLMFRTVLADDEAMLFPSDPPAPRSFWMKNTPISLDIIFVGVDGRISNIAANTVPYSLESLPSDGPSSAVFEVRAGLAADLGITPGDRVSYSLD